MCLLAGVFVGEDSGARKGRMIIQAGNAVAAWIYLWMTFQLGFYESTDLLPRVS